MRSPVVNIKFDSQKSSINLVFAFLSLSWCSNTLKEHSWLAFHDTESLCLKVTFLRWYHSSVCGLTLVRNVPFLTECFLLPPLPFSLLYKTYPNKVIFFYKAGDLAGTRCLGPAKPRQLKVAIKDFANTIYIRGTAAAFLAEKQSQPSWSWLHWPCNKGNLFIIPKISH